MNRSPVITAVVAALLVGCGSASLETSSSSPDPVERLPLSPTLPTAPDPWLEAVMAARNPIAVAYGLPDDSAVATRLLHRSYERKKARCMQRLGFQYEPFLDFDPSSDRRNNDWINSQPLDVRKAYAAARPKCGDEASRMTFLAAALGDSVANDAPPLNLPTRELTDEERRQMDIAYVVEHRDVLERLVADLEVE